MLQFASDLFSSVYVSMNCGPVSVTNNTGFPFNNAASSSQQALFPKQYWEAAVRPRPPT